MTVRTELCGLFSKGFWDEEWEYNLLRSAYDFRSTLHRAPAEKGLLYNGSDISAEGTGGLITELISQRLVPFLAIVSYVSISHKRNVILCRESKVCVSHHAVLLKPSGKRQGHSPGLVKRTINLSGKVQNQLWVKVS